MKGYWKKGTGEVIEIDSNTVKQAIMRMKNGRAAGPVDIPIELIKEWRSEVIGNDYHIAQQGYKWRESTVRVEGGYYNIDT